MIPFLDLKAQYLSVKDDIDAAIARVLESGQFSLGKEVAAFEEEFAAYCQTKFAIGVNSGTSALHLALLTAGVEAGDQVITVPMTFVGTVAAIRYTGATPVFVDIDPCSYTMDFTKIENAITPQTKVILPVHLYGQMADMDPIMEIARRHSLIVIEDAAQAHGAEYKGRRSGSIGDLGCFSFYPSKNLGAYGEGGMVTTNNPEYEKIIRMLRNWGQVGRCNHVLKGFNYRMDGIQGAILRAKLCRIDEWTEARRRLAASYDLLLAGSGVTISQTLPTRRHVYHIYAIRTPQRDILQQTLRNHDMQAEIHYPAPIHLMQAHDDLGYQSGDFPHSERLAREELSLPLYPELPEEALEQVVECIRNASMEAIHR
ncbi:DegT/DnrJ/EryC1/StrS family aminotransferase [Acidobacteria bacterium AH-259-L09]|nr:DegT/DnrJ/EryC1/StrS family aminotransferase [Acidobacteria bacterium AH-259-L09]